MTKGLVERIEAATEGSREMSGAIRSNSMADGNSSSLAEKLNAVLAAGGPELTQCLLDIGLVRRDGNRLVRTSLGDRALEKIDQMKGLP